MFSHVFPASILRLISEEGSVGGNIAVDVEVISQGITGTKGVVAAGEDDRRPFFLGCFGPT
jgi:hypothetical protein